MTEPKDNPQGRAQPRLKRLLCYRTGLKLELNEHESCPYCFGHMDEIESGHHEEFCDYKVGEDPRHFGFPGADRRSETG